MPITNVLSQITADKHEVGYLSHTQVSMFLRCPKQWECRYVLGMKLPPGGALVQGSSYHKGLETGYSLKIQNAEPVEQTMLDAADQEWNKRLAEFGTVEWGDDPGKLKDVVMGVLKTYRTEVMPLIKPKKVEINERINVGGIPFVRVRDLVAEDGGVIDHKLTSQRYGMSQIYTDIQSLAYVYPDGGKFHYHIGVKGRSKLSKFQYEVQVIDFSRTKAEVDWWVELVKKVYAQIKSGIYPPNPGGYWCSPKFCGYWKICREGGKVG